MIHVICNPTAGNGKALKIGHDISDALQESKAEHLFFNTAYPGHATELARNAVLEGADTVISVGGDGTLREIVYGLYNTDTALGIIPAGTGNDFIKSLGTPKDVMAALDVILKCGPKKTDVVRLNDQIFVNESGAGFDVMVLDYAARAKKYCQGLLPYLYGVIRTIFHYKSVHIAYTLDDGPRLEKDILVVAVGNGRFIGGGIPISPTAVPDDGYLDAVIVGGMSRLRMLSVLPGLMKAKILTFKESEHVRIRKMTMEGKDLRVNIDGEIRPIDRLEIEILPGALLIRRP